jgi:hypothetical protein
MIRMRSDRKNINGDIIDNTICILLSVAVAAIQPVLYFRSKDAKDDPR